MPNTGNKSSNSPESAKIIATLRRMGREGRAESQHPSELAKSFHGPYPCLKMDTMKNRNNRRRRHHPLTFATPRWASQ
jgi:hypothetical protein